MSSSKKAIAIVPAAGSGARMGLPQSKLLCKIAGVPLIAKTIEALSQGNHFSKIIIPCRDQDRENFSECLKGINTKIDFCQGGMTRQESVKLALQYFENSEKQPSDFLVLIHDAARCFVSAELIKRSLIAAQSLQAVTAAVALTDTVYQIDEHEKIKLPLLQRTTLRAIQTPQVFEFGLLKSAHQLTHLSASDDAGLVAHIHPIALVEGELSNFKITTMSDLERAKDACSLADS